MNQNQWIKVFIAFMNSVDKYKVDAPEKVGMSLKPLIEDIIFDVSETGEIVTKRIYEAVRQALRINTLDTAKNVVNDFVLWLKKNKQYLNEAVEYGKDFTEFEIDETLLEEFEVNENRARAPKLKGIAAKKRQKQAEVMSKLNKNPAYVAAANKLLMIANREAKKIAREAGIAPNLIDVSKVIVRKSSVDAAADKKQSK